MAKRPNILFLQVDQLTAFALKAYGDKVCKTPTLDSLANRGVVFETAYCNSPLCVPSRASMATGQLSSNLDVFDSGTGFSETIPTYAHYLRQLGYQTSVSGKLHFIGPDQYHGFEKRLTSDLYPSDFSWTPDWRDAAAKGAVNDSRGVLVSGICERSVQIDFDEEVSFKAIQNIYDIARSDDDRPFFMQVSFIHPHDPYLCKKEFWDLYENAAIPLPKVSSLPEAEHDAHSVRLLTKNGMLGMHFKDEYILRAKRAYYGSISYVDQMIGKIIEALNSTGAGENTAIMFTSDHGDMLGERGLWFKLNFYEYTIRVPLFLYAPWIKPQRIKETVSLVDVLPTLNGLASGGELSDAVELLEGIDLTTLLDKGNPNSGRAIYAEFLAGTTPAPIFMIRRGNHKYISSSKDPKLLFDLEADPNELVNLAEQPEHAALVAKFETEVQEKWNEPEIVERILVSQRRRKFIHEAMKKGTPTCWAHDENPNDDILWYRGVGDFNDWAYDYLPRQESKSTT